MSENTHIRPRLVTARRVSSLTGLVALTAAGLIAGSDAHAEGESSEASVIAAQAEGEGEGPSDAGASASNAAEGEGEGGSGELDDTTALLSGLGFMEGHIRAGLALYEDGDLTAAKTHMGHPIEEKYGAVEAQFERSGHGALEGQIAALAAATEAEADMAEIEARFAEVRDTMEAVRADYPASDQIAGLIALTRIAGEEYAAAVGDGDTVSDLHEYQDSWGFLRVVEAEAEQMAGGDDAEVAAVAQDLLEQVAATGDVYGDLQGGGDFDADPAVIFGAAARMEFAAQGLDEGEGEGAADVEGEGEGGEGASR